MRKLRLARNLLLRGRQQSSSSISSSSSGLSAAPGAVSDPPGHPAVVNVGQLPGGSSSPTTEGRRRKSSQQDKEQEEEEGKDEKSEDDDKEDKTGTEEGRVKKKVQEQDHEILKHAKEAYDVGHTDTVKIKAPDHLGRTRWLLVKDQKSRRRRGKAMVARRASVLPQLS